MHADRPSVQAVRSRRRNRNARNTVVACGRNRALERLVTRVHAAASARSRTSFCRAAPQRARRCTSRRAVCRRAERSVWQLMNGSTRRLRRIARRLSESTQRCAVRICSRVERRFARTAVATAATNVGREPSTARSDACRPSVRHSDRHEASRLRAVDRAMIVAQRDRQHLPRFELRRRSNGDAS